MKKLLMLSLTLISFCIVFTACSNDDDQSKTEETIDLQKVLNNKWIITDSTNIKSIEFNESSNYILVGNIAGMKRSTGDSIYYGNYTIIDEVNKIIELKEAKMRIKITNYEDETIEFTLTLLDTSKEYIFKAIKGKEIASTTKTDLLCRTWVIVKYETTDPDEDVNQLINTTVLFSKAGTYYVANPNDPETGGIAKWEWISGSNETQVAYFWEDYSGEGYITIVELTQQSLVITEIVEDSGEKNTSTYTFKPYDSKEDNTKVNSVTSEKKNIIKKGNYSLLGKK